MKRGHILSLGRRLAVVLGILVISVAPLNAKETTVTVLDFEVQSSERSHEYLGKGFAEFISVELSTIKQVVLVEREKRNEILDEMKFSLSGLTDDKDIMEIGKLLSSHYLITGSIFNMSGVLAITGRLIDVETGTVIIHSSSEGTMKEYKKITQQLTYEFLKALELEDQYTVQTVEGSSDDETVLASFSEAMDAYDKGENEEALEKLQKASKIDKKNKAVRRYINKLNIVTPKYQFEASLWGSAYNPALAAGLDKGIVFLNGDIFEPWKVALELGYVNNMVKTPSGDEVYFESNMFPGTAHLGYLAPLGEKFGIGIEMNWVTPFEYVEIYKGKDDPPKNVPIILDGEKVDKGFLLFLGEMYAGTTIGTSYRFSEMFSAGVNGSIYFPVGGFEQFQMEKEGNVIIYTDWDSDADDRKIALPDEAGFSFGLGFILKPLAEKLYIDFSALYPFITRYYYDIDQDAIINGTYPIYLSAAVNGQLIKNHLYIGLKSSFDIYKDPEATGFFLKETPVLEWWIFPFLSIRGGYILSYLSIDQQQSLGHGFMAGLTVKIGDFYIDLNYNRREAPLTSVGGFAVPHASFLINISFQNMPPRR
jgi:TolB-like protein